MKKTGLTVNGLMSMFPDADIRVDGSGPYWYEADIIHTSGYRLTVTSNSEFEVDTRKYGEVETVVLKGVVNDG